MAIEYTKFAFLILGLLFSPVQAEEHAEAYFCAINIDDFEPEPLMFECKDDGKRFVFFSEGLDSKRIEYFSIERKQGQGFKFSINNPSDDTDTIEIDLNDYFQGIEENIFDWDSGATKTLQFKNGNSITVRKVGKTVYMKTDEFKDMLFVIHK